jgi:hypothetical protein
MTAAPESGAGKAEASHLDFFISYTRADERWAEWIAWELEAAGYTTKIMAWDFRPGTSFPREMQEAATRAQRTLAVLSPATSPPGGTSFGNIKWNVSLDLDSHCRAN